jgi:2,3-bisphosphoglycerate-independent phosphoglycerate mutase
MTTKPNTLLLLIFDGCGYRKEKKYNAIANAQTPIFDKLWETYPHTLLGASGEDVGLPAGQMGNSEVGHLNLGAGRVVYQDLSRITNAIEDGTFFENPALKGCMEDLAKHDKALHLFGLLSPGGVHSHETHLFATVRMAAKLGVKHIYIHAFLDGRDTPPKSATNSLKAMQDVCEETGVARIASLAGRYYPMDRDKRWNRVEPAYHLYTTGQSDFHAEDAISGLDQAYARGETDEFVQPTRVGKPVPMEDGDAIIFCNFRPDRARELSHAYLDEDFKGFTRKARPKLSHYICFTEYDKALMAELAFQPEHLDHVLAEYLPEQGLKQFHIAETEKYAHVTFFLNGGVEKPFPGEDRQLIPSPHVATYDLQPEMSANGVTEDLVKAIQSKKYDVIICNYANGDMVGHTGKYDAAVAAITYLDTCLKKVTAAIEETNSEMIIVADHGNADQMYDEVHQQPHTAHTLNPVPFVYVGRPATIIKNDGVLSDVTVTMLYLLGLPIPKEMTGKPLVKLDND